MDAPEPNADPTDASPGRTPAAGPTDARPADAGPAEAGPGRTPTRVWVGGAVAALVVGVGGWFVVHAVAPSGNGNVVFAGPGGGGPAGFGPGGGGPGGGPGGFGPPGGQVTAAGPGAVTLVVPPGR